MFVIEVWKVNETEGKSNVMLVYREEHPKILSADFHFDTIIFKQVREEVALIKIL